MKKLFIIMLTITIAIFAVGCTGDNGANGPIDTDPEINQNGAEPDYPEIEQPNGENNVESDYPEDEQYNDENGTEQDSTETQQGNENGGEQDSPPTEQPTTSNGQSDFAQAQQLMNNTLDILDARVDNLFAILSNVTDASEVDQRFDFFTIVEGFIDTLDALADQLEVLNLTEHEQQQLEAIAESRLGALLDRVMRLHEESLYVAHTI